MSAERPQIVIERVAAEDVAELHRIRLAVRENRLSDPTRVRIEDYLALLEDPRCAWKANVGGEIVGFAIGDLARSNVWALFVAPDSERRGVGRALFDALVESMFAAGATRLWLTTDPASRAAGFYDAAGWERCGFEGADLRFELGRDAWNARRAVRAAPRKS